MGLRGGEVGLEKHIKPKKKTPKKHSYFFAGKQVANYWGSKNFSSKTGYNFTFNFIHTFYIKQIWSSNRSAFKCCLKYTTWVVIAGLQSVVHLYFSPGISLEQSHTVWCLLLADAKTTLNCQSFINWSSRIGPIRSIILIYFWTNIWPI